MKIFRFLFSNFREQWKLKFNEFIFQFSKKGENWNSFANSILIASAANMADRDPAENKVFISRAEGEGRIERTIRKSLINTDRLAFMFAVSSEIIVFAVFSRVRSIKLTYKL